MNVLLTSVGRRAYMVKYFKEAIGTHGLVHVSNSDDNTVAFCYSDCSVISPMIYDEAYIPFLLNYCQVNKIDIVVSLFDIDLPILASHKDDFAKIGTKVIVSDVEFVGACNDKWKTYEYLKNYGFHVPKTYKTLMDVEHALMSGEVDFPIVVKPRFGCGSIGLHIAEDRDELEYLYKKTTRQIESSYLRFETNAVDDKVVFQEYLRGQEYGVDIINDLEGNFKNAIVKKKIAMRAGETDIAEIVEHPGVLKEVRRLGAITKHISNLDCDVFVVNDTPYFLEMNARFGGGYPFSHVAGCNLPKAILRWSENLSVDDELLAAKPSGRIYKELVLTTDNMK